MQVLVSSVKAKTTGIAQQPTSSAITSSLGSDRRSRSCPGAAPRSWLCEPIPRPNRPHHLKQDGPEAGAYVRVGSTNRRADRELIEELRRFSRGKAFDEQPVPDLAGLPGSPGTTSTEKMVRLVATLGQQQAEAERLDTATREDLKTPGLGAEGPPGVLSRASCQRIGRFPLISSRLIQRSLNMGRRHEAGPDGALPDHPHR